MVDDEEVSASVWETDPMSRALIKKVREQALELTELNDKLCVANDHIILCERRISELLSTSLPNSPYGSPTRAAILARTRSRIRKDAESTSAGADVEARETCKAHCHWFQTD